MSGPIRIGLAGLGTVGGEVARLLHTEKELFEKRAGREIKLTAISARDRKKQRTLDLSSILWSDNPVDLVNRPDVDVVVELMGGSEGAARDLAEASLKAGKPFITANKALLAHHGKKLAALARKNGTPIYFEASVAGAIPVIKTIREALAGDQVQKIYGILNGTCNYILTTMQATGRSFKDILKEAQALGYAEADASFDLGGMDAAHKLAILSALAFGVPLEVNKFPVDGIQSITPQDIQFAQELGYRIKLLCVARLQSSGLMQRVSTYMVPVSNTLAHVDGVMNAVFIRSSVAGPLTLMGHGAGAGPTASAVLSDIIDCACGRHVDLRALTAEDSTVTLVPPEKNLGSFYLRVMVHDRPGVLADITAIMRDQKISIQSLIQHGRSEAAPVPVVFLTHDTTEQAFAAALAALKKLPSVLDEPCVIRILP